MFTHILVPLDGSPLAETALPNALALAAVADATLTLISVVPPSRDMLDYYIPYDASGEAAALARTGNALDAVAQNLRATGVYVTTAVATGDPATEILRYAEESGVDLIVMASHGRGGAFHWAFGSVARKVLTAATVPTLAVRAKEAPAEPYAPAPIRSIFVPLDGSDRAAAALPLASSLARTLGAHVTLMRVVPFIGGIYLASPYAPLVAPEAYDETMANLHKTAEAYLDAEAEGFRNVGIPVETCVREGDAANALLDVLDTRTCDLVVMTTHGRTGISRWVMGSVAEHLIEASHTPVLLVRSASEKAESDTTATVTVGTVHDAANAAR